MSLVKFLVVAAAASMAVAPAMAQSANPAAGLSLAPVAKSVRVATPLKKKSKIGQAGVIVLVILAAGGIAGGIAGATSGGSPASP